MKFSRSSTSEEPVSTKDAKSIQEELDKLMQYGQSIPYKDMARIHELLRTPVN